MTRLFLSWGNETKKWALMLVNDSRQLAEAAQHHRKELLEDEGTSKYFVFDDDTGPAEGEGLGRLQPPPPPPHTHTILEILKSY